MITILNNSGLVTALGENIFRVSLNCRIIKTIFVNCLNLADAWGRNYVYSIRPTEGTKTL